MTRVILFLATCFLVIGYIQYTLYSVSSTVCRPCFDLPVDTIQQLLFSSRGSLGEAIGNGRQSRSSQTLVLLSQLIAVHLLSSRQNTLQLFKLSFEPAFNFGHSLLEKSFSDVAQAPRKCNFSSSSTSLEDVLPPTIRVPFTTPGPKIGSQP